jgi:hypothetical protein
MRMIEGHSMNSGAGAQHSKASPRPRFGAF